MKYKGLKLPCKQIAWENQLRFKLELIDHKICNYENKTSSVINIDLKSKLEIRLGAT